MKDLKNKENNKTMKTLNGINLEYNNQKRNNYMSKPDLFNDLTTDCLIKILPTLQTLKAQMSLMRILDQRNINDNLYFDLLESCNGF
jgi:hypothetical protein